MVTGAMMVVTGRDHASIQVTVLITTLAITTWKTLLSHREREERELGQPQRLVAEEGVFLSIGHLAMAQLRSRVKARGTGEVAVEDSGSQA